MQELPNWQYHGNRHPESAAAATDKIKKKKKRKHDNNFAVLDKGRHRRGYLLQWKFRATAFEGSCVAAAVSDSNVAHIESRAGSACVEAEQELHKPLLPPGV